MDNDLIGMIDDILKRDSNKKSLNSIYSTVFLAANNTYYSDFEATEHGRDNVQTNYPYYGGVEFSHESGHKSSHESGHKSSHKSDYFGNDFSSFNIGHFMSKCAAVFSSHFDGNFSSVKSSHHSSQGS